MKKQLTPELICELPVHAASGLVIFQENFYIVADDELSLLIRDSKGVFSTYTLWEGELPEDVMARKKIKPDLESLFLHHHTLYAVPSGSKKNRTSGARIFLDETGKITHHEAADFEGLFERLSSQVKDLNIEGALAWEKDLLFFQRGNGKNAKNAVIRISDWPSTRYTISEIHLPLHQGVPLTITDAAEMGGKIFFLAVAENTESTYLDGEVMGAFIGRLEGTDVAELTPLMMKGKPEGIAFHPDGYVYVVTDDDSRILPSRLLRFKL